MASVRLAGTHEELQRASAAWLDSLAARYLAYRRGEDDLGDLSVAEMVTAAGYYHSREQHRHDATTRAALVHAELRRRTTPGSRPRKAITDQQLAGAWVRCCRDFPNLKAVQIDAAVGEELGISERSVRGRRGAWKVAGGIKAQMRAIRGKRQAR